MLKPCGARAMSFQLVDRITSFRPGAGAIGQFEPPPMEGALPLGLLVEAIGQLAGWVAMQKSSFALRPVAAAAGLVTVHALSEAGGPVDLEVETTGFRHGAVSYQGLATVGGEPVLNLERAVGPLLPMEEFDDAARMQELFRQVRGDGLPARPLVSPDDYRPTIALSEHLDDRIRASLHLPEASAIYADHFPRRPLYPATLMLGAQIDETVARFTRDDGTPRQVREVRGVKVRAFSGPGEKLRLEVDRESEKDDGLAWFRATTWKDDARVASMRVGLER